MQERKENKMGTMPVSRLLITMSLPIVVSMLVQALYNIVDSVFVSRYSQEALTAVSLAFPVQNLLIAVGVGTGVGINALLSRRLGERNFEDANAAAENGLLLAVLSGLVFAVLGLLFSRTFFCAFTRNEEIIRMGTEYLTVCTVFSFGAFLQMASERILQATGNTIYNMISQCVGALTNIILDPIFIFGYFGFPAMGVKGAAVATVAGQILGMCLALYFNVEFNHDVKLNLRAFRPSKRIIGEIYKVGIPSIIMQSIASVMTFGLNKILVSFTETATLVFGVYFKLQSFVFMPVFGLTSGMVPIVAYNYGARRKDRITHVIRDAALYAVSIMAVGSLVFHLFPQQLLLFFKASAETLEIGTPALRIISLSFVGAGIAIVLSSVFQALGNGVLSLLISVARQLLVILPVAWLLAQLGGLNVVWWAFPIAELVSLGLSLLMYRKIYVKMIAPLVSEES
ncbi:MAG: MATE family efflux transporter [Anaerotruncus sp.]|nr:MATE family efflux transporter [Anaerotruncus sp.]